MSQPKLNEDRRVAFRKEYALPVRYTVLTEELVSVPYVNPRAEAARRSHALPESLHSPRRRDRQSVRARNLFHVA